MPGHKPSDDHHMISPQAVQALTRVPDLQWSQASGGSGVSGWNHCAGGKRRPALRWLQCMTTSRTVVTLAALTPRPRHACCEGRQGAWQPNQRDPEPPRNLLHASSRMALQYRAAVRIYRASTVFETLKALKEKVTWKCASQWKIVTISTGFIRLRLR